MPYTQTQLATRVLRDLGLYGPDETPTDDDMQDAFEVIASEVAGMAVRNLPIWNGSDVAVPTEYLTALSRRLGLAVGVSFGVFTMIEAVAGIEPSERYLRQLSAKSPTYEPAESTAF